jgi:hypothetical protein
VGDRVLLQVEVASTDREAEIPASPWIGAVFAVDPRNVYVRHVHQGQDDMPVQCSRRNGGRQVVDPSGDGVAADGLRLRLLGKAVDEAADKVLDGLTAHSMASRLFGLGLAVDQLPLEGLLEYTTAKLQERTTRGGTRDMLEAADRLARALLPFQREARAVAEAADLTGSGGVAIV